MKRASRESKADASNAETPPVRVAYHDGPPAIHFAGLPWTRGVAQEVTAGKWSEMRARGDCRDFDFRPEPESQAQTKEN